MKLVSAYSWVTLSAAARKDVEIYDNTLYWCPSGGEVLAGLRTESRPTLRVNLLDHELKSERGAYLLNPALLVHLSEVEITLDAPGPVRALVGLVPVKDALAAHVRQAEAV